MIPSIKLTKRQKLLIDFLVKRIGFSVNDAFTKDFIDAFVKYSHFDEARKDSTGDGRIFKNFSIEKLTKEIEIRSDWNKYKKENLSNDIYATDIENYTFCPVAYSISKSFDVPQNIDAKTGEELHRKELFNDAFNMLPSDYGIGKCFASQKTTRDKDVVKYDNTDNLKSIEQFFKYQNKQFYEDLRDSELIFPLEFLNEKKVFRSKKGNFVGRPDYIFKNSVTGKFFVIEEKFRFYDYSLQPNNAFYKNHSNQLRAYIYCIDEFSIDYGYLVYWDFVFDYGVPVISEARVKRIEKNQRERKLLEDVYRKIQNTIRAKGGNFINDYRNPQKCAKCGTSIFCGHKTGKFKTYDFPYSYKHLKLKNVSYPEELRKSSKVEQIVINNTEYSLYNRIFRKHISKIIEMTSFDYTANNKTRYEAMWLINDDKLYLQYFMLFEKYINNKPDSLYEYTGENIHCDFVTGTFKCFLEINHEEENTETEFKEVRLILKNGLIVSIEEI